MIRRPRTVRRPAVAGTFYPAERDVLADEIRRALDGAADRPPPDRVPAALIVPHAGYAYSGPVAASAYRLLEPARRSIRRVVLLGPAHRVPLRGLGLSGADAWETPLGQVLLDQRATSSISSLSAVEVNDRAHGPEHSLEVQLPFLQMVLDDFALVPLVVGDATTDEVAAVLDAVWDDPGSLVVVSTDLSHYHSYGSATTVDARTVASIVARRPEEIGSDQACGVRPLRGLLSTAASRDLAVVPLDVRNSGDIAGDRDRVVGYASFAVG